MLLSDVEGLLQVVGCIGSRQLVELYQVRPGGDTMMKHSLSCLYGSNPKITCQSNPAAHLSTPSLSKYVCMYFVSGHFTSKSYYSNEKNERQNNSWCK